MIIEDAARVYVNLINFHLPISSEKVLEVEWVDRDTGHSYCRVKSRDDANLPGGSTILYHWA